MPICVSGQLEVQEDKLYSFREEKKKLENSLETAEETLKEKLQNNKDNVSDCIFDNNYGIWVALEELQKSSWGEYFFNNIQDVLKNSLDWNLLNWINVNWMNWIELTEKTCLQMNPQKVGKQCLVSGSATHVVSARDNISSSSL